jgi:aspartate aminotransferase
VITLPDNPTGTLAPPDLVAEVCQVADDFDLTVISDEIYRDLCPADAGYRSPAELLPERTIVTTGLSKSQALGGYRIGFLRLPATADPDLRAELVGLASEVWSCLAGPQQRVAEWALAEPDVLTAHIAASRRLHHAVTNAVYQVFLGAGVSCRAPAGPFYLYPDFAPRRERLAEAGVHTGQQLADALLSRYGVGVLAGVEFGDDPAALRFRAATSLLYGATADQRWAALRSADPTSLPWIRDALTQLDKALTGLLDLG